MNKTAKNTTIYFVGTIVMGACGLLNTMIITRMLEPEAYVMYGFLHSFVTAAIMFLCFGLDTAYSRFYYNHNYTQKRFLFRVMVVPVGLFVVFACLLLEPSQWIVRQIFDVELHFVLLIFLLLYLLFSLLHRFTQLTARMEERALNYVSSNFVGKFGFAIIIFVVFLLVKRKIGFDWVLLSSVIGAVLATLLNLWIFLTLRTNRNANGTAISNREMLAYGLPHMMNSVLLSAIPLIEKMVVRGAASEEKELTILGVYTAAAAFQSVVFIVTQTVNNIWNPLVFKHCDNVEKFKPIMHSFGQVVTVITVTGFAVCVLLRRWLVLVLDREYFDAYIIAPAVCFGACYSLVAVIYGSGINIVKKTIHHVIEPLIQIVLSVTCCYLLIPSLELKGVGIAVLVSIVISRTYKNIVGLRLYDSGSSEHKMWILMGICTAVGFATLLFTSFVADLAMFIVLITALLVIMNKDLKSIMQTAKALLLTRNKTKTD